MNLAGSYALFGHVRSYVEKHGLRRTLRVVLERLQANAIGHWEWVYSADLNDPVMLKERSAHDMAIDVVRHDSRASLDTDTVRQIMELKSDWSMSRSLARWFQRGAVLWVAKQDNTVVGVAWTLRGGIRGMYSVPLAPREAIIAAVEVFASYRGRGIMALMIQHLTEQLAANGMSRVYVKVASGNTSSIRGMSKTRFVCLGKSYTAQLGRFALCVWDSTTFPCNGNRGPAGA